MFCFSDKKFLNDMSVKYGVSADAIKNFLGDDKFEDASKSVMEDAIKERFKRGTFQTASKELAAALLEEWNSETDKGTISFPKTQEGLLARIAKYKELSAVFGKENMDQHIDDKGNYVITIAKPIFGVETTSKTEPSGEIDHIKEGDRIIDILKQYSAGKKLTTEERKAGLTVTDFANPFEETEESKLWSTPALALGNTLDKIVRDFFKGNLKTSYPNLTSQQFEHIKQDLEEFKANLDKKFEGHKYKVVTDVFTMYAKMRTKDVNGNPLMRTLRGSVDMIIYDDEGNFYIYDTKVKRSGLKEQEYQKQLSAYKALLEANFPQLKGRIKELNILEFSVHYPQPFTKTGSDSNPTIVKTVEYNTEKGQLYMNGKPIQTYPNDNQQELYYTPPRYRQIAPREIMEFEEEFESMDDFEKDLAEEEFGKPKEQPVYTPEKIDIDRNSLYNNPLVSAEDRSYLSSYVMKTASLIITDLQSDPTKAEEYFGESFKGINLTSRSRKEIVDIVGLDRIFSYIRDTYFDTDNRANDDLDVDTAEELDLVFDNWQTLLEEGYTKLIALEQVSIKADRDVKEDSEEVNPSDDPNTEPENNEREYWQIHFRQISLMTNLSAMIRRELERLQQYTYDSDGKLVIKMHDRFKMPEFIDANQAVQSIMEWCKDCSTVEEMHDTLKNLVETYPWLSVITGVHDDVNDMTGLLEQEPFRSQFFVNFRKDFTEYSVVLVTLDSNGNRVYTTHTINTRGASVFAMDHVRANFLEGKVKLLTSVNALGKGIVNMDLIKQLAVERKNILEALARSNNRKVTLNENFKAIQKQLTSFGITMPDDILRGIITQDLRVNGVENTAVYKMMNSINYISEQFGKQYRKHKDETTGYYNPLLRDDEGKKEEGNVYGDYQDIINHMVPFMQDGIEASTYQGGKMYYSFQTPSYMGKLIRNLSDAANNPKKFSEFMQKEYKNYKWFYNSDTETWNNFMLQQLEGDSKARQGLAHKVQLSFGDNAYKDLSEMAYTLSLMSEFFFDKNAEFSGGSRVWAWYRVPILSNKPSSEFVKFYRYIGRDYKKTILKPLIRTARQELMRMQAVLEEAVDADARIDHWSLTEEFLDEHPDIKRKLESRDDNGELKEKLTFNDLVKDGKLVTAGSGAEFKFMATLNEQFINKTELGKLMLRILNGEQLTKQEANDLNNMLSTQIEEDMNRMFESEMFKWEDLGLLEKESKDYFLQKDVIENGKKKKRDVKIPLPTYKYLGSFIPSPRKIFQDLEKTFEGEVYKPDGKVTDEFMNLFKETQDKYVRDALENYMWNDLLATINIIQVTATDLAYYKNVEDFQKRYAAVHSPGLRMNTEARDEKGVKFSEDGLCRVLHLKDVIEPSEIKENVRQIFNERIERERNPESKEALRKMCELIINLYDKVNLTDGQGYSSPTSYRKKLGMMGRWNSQMEKAYERITKGTYTVEDLGIVLQPLKPFVYTQMGKSIYSDTMPEVKVSMQVKDSEYLLLLADALMRGSNSKSKLVAIFDFMEDTAYDGRESNEGKIVNEKYGTYNGCGIDTVAFVSTSKFGSRGTVDISDEAIKDYKKTHKLDNSVSDYSIIKTMLKDAAYLNETSSSLADRYNDDYVHTFSFEDYALQQEVPNHFMDEKRSVGSQIRILNISDVDQQESFEISNSNREGDSEKLTGAEVVEEYQNLIAENIEDSFKRLAKEFKLDSKDEFERNEALERILREAIQKDSRYGTDMMRACTIIREGPNRGKFNIPLCDPIQSIRVQQLINSIIKRDINKQEFKGGSVVQTSVFGMSDSLSIRFQDNEGNLLETFTKFRNKPENESLSDKEAAAKYRKDVVSKQGRLAHWEVYMTVPSEAMEKMLREASERDNIDYFHNVDEAVKNGVIQEEQLKAICYRIPTEDKYSAAPIRIKAFLPRAAGEVMMMPKEVTLLTGSDFDIDKMYILLKDFSNPKFTINNLKLEKEDKNRIIRKVQELHPEFVKEVDAVTEESFSDPQKIEIFDKIYETVPFLKEFLKGIRDASGEYTEYEGTDRRGNKVTKRKYDNPVNYYLNHMPDNSASTQWRYGIERMAKTDGFDNLTEWKQFLVMRAAHELDLTPEVIKVKKDSYVALDDNAIAESGRTKYSVFKEAADELNISLKEKIIDRPFVEKTDRDTRAGRNNRMFDLQWAILTAKDTATKMFNPGSFDVQKRSARIVTILKRNDNKYTYEELNRMSLDELEDIAGDSVGSNILLSTTQVYFHKQNMTAGKLIGIFANNNTSHAFLSLQNIRLKLDNKMKFSFNGVSAEKINGSKLDDIYAKDGITFISKNIAGYLAASVDAVKDPVLNFLNLNTFTSGPAMLLARLGFDVDSISLFMTQPAIERVASEFFRLNNEGYTSSDVVINNLKLDLAKKIGWSESQVADNLERMENDLSNNEFTKEDMAMHLNVMYHYMSSNEATYQLKALLLFQRLMKISNQLQQMTFLTKFNSVSNAPGPSIADTLVMQYRYRRFQQLFEDKTNYFSDEARYIVENSPILNAFYKYTVSSEGASARIFRDHFPHYSMSMQHILEFFSMRLKMHLDAKTINMIINDYILYKLTAGNDPVIDMNFTIREFYIKDFANAYREEIKDISGNSLLELINIRPGDYRCPVPTLEVKSGSFNSEKRERVNNAWTDLITNPETGDLGVKLFIYNLMRSGFSFSPKTFGHCAPVDVRMAIPRYIQTLRDPNFNEDSMYGEVLDFAYQFLRNHCGNPKLVPFVEKKEGLHVKQEGDKITFTFNKKRTSVPFLLDTSNVDETHISPVIWYNNKLYMEPQDISDLGEVSITFVETTPLGNTNNFLEYNAEDSDPAHMKSVFDVHNRTREEGYVNSGTDNSDDSVEISEREQAVERVDRLTEDEVSWVIGEIFTESERATLGSISDQKTNSAYFITKVKEHLEAIAPEANRGKDGQGTQRYKKLKEIVDKLC